LPWPPQACSVTSNNERTRHTGGRGGQDGARRRALAGTRGSQRHLPPPARCSPPSLSLSPPLSPRPATASAANIHTISAVRRARIGNGGQGIG
jgi:hypothetical protein